MRRNSANIEARRVPARERKITKVREGASSFSQTEAVRLPATSRIPVSRAVWGELAGLKKPGETYNHLLEGMIEREKKNRLFEDMDRIEKRGKFVAMKW